MPKQKKTVGLITRAYRFVFGHNPYNDTDMQLDIPTCKDCQFVTLLAKFTEKSLKLQAEQQQSTDSDPWKAFDMYMEGQHAANDISIPQ